MWHVSGGMFLCSSTKILELQLPIDEIGKNVKHGVGGPPPLLEVFKQKIYRLQKIRNKKIISIELIHVYLQNLKSKFYPHLDNNFKPTITFSVDFLCVCRI
jgi:hypothetical protein